MIEPLIFIVLLVVGSGIVNAMLWVYYKTREREYSWKNVHKHARVYKSYVDQEKSARKLDKDQP